MKACCISFQVDVGFVISYWANQFVVLPSKKFGNYYNLTALVFFPFVAQTLVNCRRWEIGTSLSWSFGNGMHNTFPIVATIVTCGTNGCACCNIVIGCLVVIILLCTGSYKFNKTLNQLVLNSSMIVNTIKVKNLFSFNIKNLAFWWIVWSNFFNFSNFATHEYFHWNFILGGEYHYFFGFQWMFLFHLLPLMWLKLMIILHLHQMNKYVVLCFLQLFVLLISIFFLIKVQVGYIPILYLLILVLLTCEYFWIIN